MKSSLIIAALLGRLVQLAVLSARADETCSSPYLARIEGQEEFLYVWTLGVEGLGDGSDKLVVVDVKPGSSSYGKVVYQHSVGGRHEAHHGGFTDDRRQLWLSGLEASRIFIYDVHANPAKPVFVKTIENFEKTTATALGSTLWLCYEDEKGEWQAKETSIIGDAGGVLPVDISLSADDLTLFVDCFGDGKCGVFDVSDPHLPKQIYEKPIGKQLNMVSQSWDGKRLYLSSSLLARWDNIYSSGTLDPRLVLADIRTLMMEKGQP